MNKKGFTLVELIAIVVILSVILVIAIPTVSNIIENSRIESFNKSEVMMVEAAKGYMLLNTKYIPANIGDTTEITVAEMQANKTLGIIVNPWDGSERCSGYILTTKVAEKKYTYHPYLNCDKNIGRSNDDKLIVRYTFDDFAEPTENLLAGYHTRMTGRLGAVVTLEQNYPFKEYNIENATRVIISGANSTSTTPSATTIVSNTLNEGRTFTTTVKVKNIGQNDVGIHDNISSVIWVKPGEVREVTLTCTGRGPGTSNYMFNIRTKNATDDLDFILYELQSEEKGHSTPYTENSREGRITDYSLNNNHAVIQLSSTPKWSKDSVQGDGLYEFDGVDDYLNFGNDNIFNITDELTLSAWVKYEGDFIGGIITKGQQAGWISNSYVLRSSGGKILFYLSDGTNYDRLFFPISIGNNKWHHIVASLSQDKLAVYVDGEKTDETNRTIGPLNVVTGPLIVGQGYTSSFFRGSIDDVRIYKRTLSDNEIKRMYDVVSFKSK